MFQKILIEKRIISNSIACNIIKHFPEVEVIPIETYDIYFNKIHKPYLQKRESISLFIAEKHGHLVRKAPEAYGLSSDHHYFFIHAYNCIYECEYCYLQGYFNSPDIVLFINHEDILQQMSHTLTTHKSGELVWFHAGEFSDSLSLSHITGEIPLYWDFTSRHSNARLELRTKSSNIRAVLGCSPSSHVFTTFSLAPSRLVRTIEHKTAPLSARINAMKTLLERGYQVGVHLDPIFYSPEVTTEYEEMFHLMGSLFPLNQIAYFSLGTVRYSKNVFAKVEKNYPHSIILQEEMGKGFDGKVRYSRPFRFILLNQIKSSLKAAGVQDHKIYFCMENDPIV